MKLLMLIWLIMLVGIFYFFGIGGAVAFLGGWGYGVMATNICHARELRGLNW